MAVVEVPLGVVDTVGVDLGLCLDFSNELIGVVVASSGEVIDIDVGDNVDELVLKVVAVVGSVMLAVTAKDVTKDCTVVSRTEKISLGYDVGIDVNLSSAKITLPFDELTSKQAPSFMRPNRPFWKQESPSGGPSSLRLPMETSATTHRRPPTTP
jgi:hypothetical protein